MSYMRQKDYRRYFKKAYSILKEAGSKGYPDYTVYIRFRPEEQVSPVILEERKLLYRDYLSLTFAAAALKLDLDLVKKIEEINYQANNGGVGK